MTMTEDLKRFPVFELVGSKLIPADYIKSVNDYSHNVFNLHHFIKNSTLRKHPELIEKQRLILMYSYIHDDLHGGMEDERFFRIYKIEKKELLYQRKKHA